MSVATYSQDPTPSQVAIARERWDQWLAGQPECYHDIIRLRLAGETYDTIAEKTNTCRRTVQRVLERIESEPVS